MTQFINTLVGWDEEIKKEHIMQDRVLLIKVKLEGEPNYGDWLWDLEQEICDELKDKGFQIVSYLCEEKGGKQ